jgi:hypothetical protein
MVRFMVGQITKLSLFLLTLLMLSFSVSALTVPLYSATKVDVSLSVVTGTAGSPSNCYAYDGQCTTFNAQQGILKNCQANNDATVCHCEFWGCGSGNTCTPDSKCQGSNYADAQSCPSPGTYTYYCASGICNYNSFCGQISECNKLNGKGYTSNGVTGTLNSCIANSDPLKCDCSFTETTNPPQVPLSTAVCSNPSANINQYTCFNNEGAQCQSLSSTYAGWQFLDDCFCTNVNGLVTSANPCIRTNGCTNLGDIKCTAGTTDAWVCFYDTDLTLQWISQDLSLENYCGGTSSSTKSCKDGVLSKVTCEANNFINCDTTSCTNGYCSSSTACASCTQACTKQGYACGVLGSCNCGQCGANSACVNHQCTGVGCTNGETATCQNADGCDGTKTCVNGAYGLCISTLQKCSDGQCKSSCETPCTSGTTTPCSVGTCAGTQLCTNGVLGSCTKTDAKCGTQYGKYTTYAIIGGITVLICGFLIYNSRRGGR